MDETFTTNMYQWKTNTGAVVHEFFTEDEARAWMARRMFAISQNPTRHYPELKLVQVVTTTREIVL